MINSEDSDQPTLTSYTPMQRKKKNDRRSRIEIEESLSRLQEKIIDRRSSPYTPENL